MEKSTNKGNNNPSQFEYGTEKCNEQEKPLEFNQLKELFDTTIQQVTELLQQTEPEKTSNLLNKLPSISSSLHPSLSLDGSQRQDLYRSPTRVQSHGRSHLPPEPPGQNHYPSTRSQSHSPSPTRSQSHSPSPFTRSQSHSPSPYTRSQSHSPSPHTRSHSHSPSPFTRSQSHSPSPTRSQRHRPSPLTKPQSHGPYPPTRSKSHGPSLYPAVPPSHDNSASQMRPQSKCPCPASNKDPLSSFTRPHNFDLSPFPTVPKNQEYISPTRLQSGDPYLYSPGRTPMPKNTSLSAKENNEWPGTVLPEIEELEDYEDSEEGSVASKVGREDVSHITQLMSTLQTLLNDSAKQIAPTVSDYVLGSTENYISKNNKNDFPVQQQSSTIQKFPYQQIKQNYEHQKVPTEGLQNYFLPQTPQGEVMYKGPYSSPGQLSQRIKNILKYHVQKPPLASGKIVPFENPQSLYQSQVIQNEIQVERQRFSHGRYEPQNPLVQGGLIGQPYGAYQQQNAPDQGVSFGNPQGSFSLQNLPKQEVSLGYPQSPYLRQTQLHQLPAEPQKHPQGPYDPQVPPAHGVAPSYFQNPYYPQTPSGSRVPTVYQQAPVYQQQIPLDQIPSGSNNVPCQTQTPPRQWVTPTFSQGHYQPNTPTGPGIAAEQPQGMFQQHKPSGTGDYFGYSQGPCQPQSSLQQIPPVTHQDPRQTKTSPDQWVTSNYSQGPYEPHYPPPDTSFTAIPRYSQYPQSQFLCSQGNSVNSQGSYQAMYQSVGSFLHEDQSPSPRTPWDSPPTTESSTPSVLFGRPATSANRGLSPSSRQDQYTNSGQEQNFPNVSTQGSHQSQCPPDRRYSANPQGTYQPLSSTQQPQNLTPTRGSNVDVTAEAASSNVISKVNVHSMPTGPASLQRPESRELSPSSSQQRQQTHSEQGHIPQIHLHQNTPPDQKQSANPLNSHVQSQQHYFPEHAQPKILPTPWESPKRSPNSDSREPSPTRSPSTYRSSSPTRTSSRSPSPTRSPSHGHPSSAYSPLTYPGRTPIPTAPVTVPTSERGRMPPDMIPSDEQNESTTFDKFEREITKTLESIGDQLNFTLDSLKSK